MAATTNTPSFKTITPASKNKTLEALTEYLDISAFPAELAASFTIEDAADEKMKATRTTREVERKRS